MTLTGLLLAGGLSIRMGQDKATLLIQGQPLWFRQLNLLRELSPEAVLISARNAPGWGPHDVPVVVDSPPSRGPLSGIAAALNSMTTSHLLVLAVDLPCMTPSHLLKLVQLTTPSAGVVPWNENRFEPLAAIYAKTSAPVAQQQLDSQDFSMQSFARALLRIHCAQKYVVSLQERLLYRNLNTVADLKELTGD